MSAESTSTAETSTKSIVVAASPAAVMGVIADFERYPSWAGSVRRAQVLATGPDGRALRVAFTLVAGPVRDQYELRYTWTGDTLVEWELTSGQLMRAQHGSYALRAEGLDRTAVTYSLSVDLAVPMLGLLRRKAERVVMDTALTELKRRVEGLRV